MDNSLDSNVAMSTAGAAASIVKSLAARNSANSNFSDSGEHKNTLSFISASDLASSITPSVNASVDWNANSLYHNEQLNATQYEDILWARLLGHNILKGILFLTDYRILFVSENGKTELISIPYGTVCKIDKLGSQSTSSDSTYGIDVFCKDFRRVFFAVKRTGKLRRRLYDDMHNRSFWRKFNSTPWPPYAQKYKESLTVTAEGLEDFKNGWNVYLRFAEFERMKLPHNADQPWHIDIISNEKYTLCDTYPSVIAYPSIFKPDLSDGYADPECSLFQIRDYRSKGRLPILSWYNKHNHATITRCSQPMSGFANRLCEADRKLFQSFAECNPNQDEALFIVDARPKINARANMTLGGGYEDYPEHNFEFLGIPNIHVMRESLKKLEDLVYPFVKNNKSFFLDLDNCGWLWYVKQLIEASCKIASSVSYQNISVVVHCSDGWDRTSQLTSLSMMMLDGYYRTIEGFMVLIEKEWSSFGHKFALRIGHGEDHFGDNERSPIFVQFIDAVYQYQTQAVSAFEFNEYFLITLLDHLYSCQFGNFLCNCEKERVEQNVYENTVSLWTYMLANKETFINPFYEKSTSNEVIIPNSSIRIMKLWSNYYCRYCVNFRSTLPDQIKRWKQLQKYKQKLQSDINDFKQQIYINSKSVTGEAMENDSCPLPENMSMISMDNQLYSSAIARIDSMLLQAELSMFPDMQSADIMQASEKIIGDDVSADHSDEHSINSSTTTEDEVNENPDIDPNQIITSRI